MVTAPRLLEFRKYLVNTLRHRFWILSIPVQSQELRSMTPVRPYQLRLFYETVLWKILYCMYMHAHLLSHYHVFGKQLSRDFQSWSWHPNYAVYSTLFQGASGSLKHLAAGVPWLKDSLDEEKFTIQMWSNCSCTFREGIHSPPLFQKWNMLEKKNPRIPFILYREYICIAQSHKLCFLELDFTAANTSFLWDFAVHQVKEDAFYYSISLVFHKAI